MTYKSTKTYGHEVGLSCTFRQWRASSHCRYLHGYALAVKFVFAAEELDERRWVVDFGGIKTLKIWLESMFDHKTLVAHDDPAMSHFRSLADEGIISMVEVPATGCEKFAELIYWRGCVWLTESGYAPRVRLLSVEVREHGANSAIYTGDS